jgi:hypothetical protein
MVSKLFFVVVLTFPPMPTPAVVLVLKRSLYPVLNIYVSIVASPAAIIGNIAI